MNKKRFESSSAVLRYIAALFSVVAFAFLFGTILYNENGSGDLRFADLFFNYFEYLNIPHVYGFVAQVFTLLAGVYGVLVIAIEPLYENQKKHGLTAGIVLVICGAIILFSKLSYCAIEVRPVSNWTNYHLYGTTIAAGSLAVLAGGLNIWASYVKD